MDMPVDTVQARADDCPRCGAPLRFEDDDGTRECVCGWSERARDPVVDGNDAFQDGDDALLV